MVRIEVHGPEVSTETSGEDRLICLEAVTAVHGIYHHLNKNVGDGAGEGFRRLLTNEVLSGELFEDYEHCELIDDIPTTATKKSALMPET